MYLCQLKYLTFVPWVCSAPQMVHFYLVGDVSITCSQHLRHDCVRHDSSCSHYNSGERPKRSTFLSDVLTKKWKTNTEYIQEINKQPSVNADV